MTLFSPFPHFLPPPPNPKKLKKNPTNYLRSKHFRFQEGRKKCYEKRNHLSKKKKKKTPKLKNIMFNDVK